MYNKINLLCLTETTNCFYGYSMTSTGFNTFFHFFYNVPWTVAFLAPAVVLLLRGADAFLRPRSVRGRKIYLFFFLLWLLTAASFTLLFRRGIDFPVPVTAPFAALKKVLSTRNLEYLRSFWMNILLFVPGGMFFTGMLKDSAPERPFCSALSRSVLAVLAGIALSAAIEGIQLRFQLGRYETDDIIANGFGMFLGTLPELAAGFLKAFLGWETENGFWKKAVDLANRYWHVISYIFWGGTTTFVNWLVYYSLEGHVHYLLANATAWTVSVAFAFVSHRTFVFKSGSHGVMILVEGILFAANRAFSLALETGLMLTGVELLRMSSTVVKVIVAVIIAIVNYIVEKLVVFRKKTEPEFEDF